MHVWFSTFWNFFMGFWLFSCWKQVCHSSSTRPAPSNKKRIKWTQDLHEQFVKCVNRLGGAESKLLDFKLLADLVKGKKKLYHVYIEFFYTFIHPS